MKIIDPGHEYELMYVDLPGDKLGQPIRGKLVFVKREGEGYPGNIGHHPGTNIQEVLRALIDRVKYLDNQIPDARNKTVLYDLRNAIFELEMRAAERHDRVLPLFNFEEIELLPVCDKCGHLGCPGDCH